MPPQTTTPETTPIDFAVIKRFLPYLWPKDNRGLRIRVVIAMLLVVLSKGVQLSMGFAYGAAIDRMTPGQESGFMIAVALVVAYAGARLAGVLCDNLRNTVFERVGQEATRQLAEHVFLHLHQ